MHTVPTQSWFQEEEKKLMGEVEFKIDNLDARNLRQLNQLYAEVKKVEGVCVCVCVCECVQSRPQTPPSHEEKWSGEQSRISWASGRFSDSVT